MYPPTTNERMRKIMNIFDPIKVPFLIYPTTDLIHSPNAKINNKDTILIHSLYIKKRED